MCLEYSEYTEGLIGALFGLFFIRQRGFVSNDSSRMYGGRMIWYDGTPATTDFSSFYDSSFNPGVNRSNCYRFMTWAIKNNDFKVMAFECNQKIAIYQYLIGFSYLIDLPRKTIRHENDWDTKIGLVMDKDLSYPRRCALGDHGWQGVDGEVHCFSIVYKMLNYRPAFYRYHFVLFGLSYFRGAGYRWSDFSQNSNFEFVDPKFNPKLNTSQCYRFLANPFDTKYAVPMECSMQFSVLSVLCMYKSDQLYPDHRLSQITIAEDEDGIFHILSLSIFFS
ncbi:hypothetical protein X798_06033 [Onchocerca flexuosa]|uniref:Uncharacterized protein n=1 Tax=Onchocerca flexuosa TaxID=387005 RepID=A0A238BQY4_9BILA|nr:hypothetical protein X798_06033 [Onchocerca flexuosa]